jgi:hypothetical protein
LVRGVACPIIILLVLLLGSPSAWCDPNEAQPAKKAPPVVIRKPPFEVQQYTNYVGRSADLTNVLRSLDSSNGTEVGSALDVLALMKTNIAKETLEKVRKLYLDNATNGSWFVAAESIVVLNTAEDPRAAEFTKRAWSELPELERVHVAECLAGQGKLSGYPVLRDALSSTNVLIRMLGERGIRILQIFNYDGRVWNDAGDKIDVEGLLRNRESTNQGTAKR